MSAAEYRAVIACGPLLPRVLDRLLGALASRADLSVDRLNDLAMVGDAVSAAAAGKRPRTAISTSLRRHESGALEISFGPFAPGGAARVRRAGGLPGGGDLFAGVAKQVDVVPDGESERLALRIER